MHLHQVSVTNSCTFYAPSTINDLLRPHEDIVRNEFIPALTGGMTCSKEERLLLPLPSHLGGMGLTMFHEDAQQEYANSQEITNLLKNLTTVSTTTVSC